MPIYAAPVKDMQFLLHDVLKVTEAGIPGYADLDAGFTGAVLDEAGKVASDVLAPLNPVGDREGLRRGLDATNKHGELVAAHARK
jgi:hypothetical protein